MMEYSLQVDKLNLEEALQQLQEQSILKRFWEHDHTIWNPDPSEITNRLGWLDVPEVMMQSLPRLYRLRDSLKKDGFERVVLLGMGGSSLAPDVFRRSFGVEAGYPVLQVIDTTHPDAIHTAASSMDFQKTAFIIATKSGTTVETLSLFRFFYNKVQQVVDDGKIGDHFLAISDPGSPLIETAEMLGFREIFLNDPNIGGRYSALSFFGLVPAAIIGLDLQRLLENALEARSGCMPGVNLSDNAGAVLGTIIGGMARQGRNKLTLVMSEKIEPLGDWIEQLIAESTGKQGKGILPVIGELLADPEDYGQDRIFVYLRSDDDAVLESFMDSVKEAGHPVIKLELDNLFSFGGLFFIWEVATAIAGYWLDINPFDQPNVESAKIRAKEMVTAYQEQGGLPSEEALLESNNLALYTGAPGASAADELGDSHTVESALGDFLRSGETQGYVSIQAYLAPSTEMTRSLRDLQGQVRDATGFATTVGYGPRFLHSTGQLHKGDAGEGLFLQLTEEKEIALDIPDEAGSSLSSISFNTLIDAQALGDRRALVDANRKVMRVHIKTDTNEALESLKKMIEPNA